LLVISTESDYFLLSQCSRICTHVFPRNVLVPPVVTTICSLISGSRLCPPMSVDLVLIKQREAPYFSRPCCYMQPSSITSSSSVFMSIAPPSAAQPPIRSIASVTGSSSTLCLTLDRYFFAALKIASPVVSSNIALGFPFSHIPRNFHHFLVESPLYPFPFFLPRPLLPRFPGHVPYRIHI